MQTWNLRKNSFAIIVLKINVCWIVKFAILSLVKVVTVTVSCENDYFLCGQYSVNSIWCANQSYCMLSWGIPILVQHSIQNVIESTGSIETKCENRLDCSRFVSLKLEHIDQVRFWICSEFL